MSNSKLKYVKLLLICTGLVGISTSHADEKSLRTESREQMKNLLLSTLKDPYSADIKVVKEFPATGEIKMLCGLVNAKNGYGGYNGFEKFYIRDNEVTYVAKDGAFEFITNLAWDICEYAVQK
ncbi:hypothetical protein [Serratia ficaria]|uniref:hypothetical protein n=1 Tax=Serratia ficaria TaxID=61651 RepID=UPI0021B7249E|nr:hypothetical protein [Serratia ficaria]